MNSKVELPDTVEMNQQSDSTVESVGVQNGEPGKIEHEPSIGNGDGQPSAPTAENGNGHACVDKATNGHDQVTNGNGAAKVRPSAGIR